jgi:hypothetical protein
MRESNCSCENRLLTATAAQLLGAVGCSSKSVSKSATGILDWTTWSTVTSCVCCDSTSPTLMLP